MVKTVARIIDSISRELAELRMPRGASALSSIPVSKDEPKERPAIVPSFLDAKAAPLPEHEDFDNLLHSARVAVDRNIALENDFRILAAMIVRGAKDRISEQEMSRWDFRGTKVSPAFIREVLERKGL